MAAETVTFESPLDAALEAYRKELEKNINKATSDKNAAKKDYGSAIDQLQNKTCSLLKYQVAQGLYQNIDQCIAIGANQEANLIKLSVEDLIKESGNLKKAFGQISSTLKCVRTEVYKVKEMACNLVECCLEKERHENEDLHKLLTGSNGVVDLDDQLDMIKSKAETAYEFADYTFDAAVKNSGIQGFANIESLLGNGKDLVAAMETFLKNVEDNWTSLSSAVTSCFAERSEMVAQISIVKCKTYDACCEEQAYCDTWNRTCDECAESSNHPEKGDQRLREICEKFKPDLGTPGGGGNPKLKQPPLSSGPTF